LRLIFVNEFINGAVDVRIESDFVFEGSQWSFEGQIDFSTYEETEICDGCSDGVKVSIIEDQWREAFLRNQDVDLDLLNETALDGTDVGPFNLGEVTLHSQELYLQGVTKQLAASGPHFGGSRYTLPLYVQNNDFKGPFGLLTNPTGINFGVPNTNVYFQNNANDARTFILNGKVKFRYRRHVVFVGIFSQNLIYYIIDSGNNIIFEGLLMAGLMYNDNIYRDLEYTFTNYSLTLNPGDRFVIVADYAKEAGNPSNTISRNIDFSYPEENYLTYTEYNRDSASLCRGVYIYDFLDRIVTKMTGQAGRVRSDYFEYGGCQWNHLITTGLFIRNGQLLEEAEPQIPTTYKDFFDGIDKIFCLGWEFEQDQNGDWFIRIEPRSYFFQRTITSEFFNVSGITRRPNLDLVFGNISVGFNENWKNTALSGIFEMHTNREYHVRNKVMENGATKKLDLLTDIIGSGYAIEYSRRLQFFEDNSGTSDRPNDYELFIIWLNRETVTFEEIACTGYEVAGQTGEFSFGPGTVSYGSNFIDFCDAPIANIYNIINTPARIAIRWWKWLGLNTYGLPTAEKKLFFQVGEYYTQMGSRLGNDDLPYVCNEVNDEDTTIFENANIEAALSTEAILVNPVEYTFKVPQELCDFLKYESDGKKVIQFSCGNSIFAGFLMESQNTPTGEAGGETEFTLVATEPILPDGRAYSQSAYSNGYG
jgi:hypothetical protein